MDEIGGAQRKEKSTSVPDRRSWRQDIDKLAPLTGLRFETFEGDERRYAAAAARIVSPPRLPAILPALPAHFVKPPLVENIVLALTSSSVMTQTRGVVIFGIGGSGKSVIASAVARDKTLRRHFRDGVLWLKDEPGNFSEERFLGQLNALAQQFRDLVLVRHYRQGRDSQYADVLFRDHKLARDFFPMWQKKFDLRCLLVVDGVWNVVRRDAIPASTFRYWPLHTRSIDSQNVEADGCLDR